MKMKKKRTSTSADGMPAAVVASAAAAGLACVLTRRGRCGRDATPLPVVHGSAAHRNAAAAAGRASGKSGPPRSGWVAAPVRPAAVARGAEDCSMAQEWERAAWATRARAARIERWNRGVCARGERSERFFFSDPDRHTLL